MPPERKQERTEDEWEIPVKIYCYASGGRATRWYNKTEKNKPGTTKSRKTGNFTTDGSWKGHDLETTQSDAEDEHKESAHTNPLQNCSRSVRLRQIVREIFQERWESCMNLTTKVPYLSKDLTVTGLPTGITFKHPRLYTVNELHQILSEDKYKIQMTVTLKKLDLDGILDSLESLKVISKKFRSRVLIKDESKKEQNPEKEESSIKESGIQVLKLDLNEAVVHDCCDGIVAAADKSSTNTEQITELQIPSIKQEVDTSLAVTQARIENVPETQH